LFDEQQAKHLYSFDCKETTLTLRGVSFLYQTNCCLTDKYGKISQASGGRGREIGHLTAAEERRFPPTFQVQKGQKMEFGDGSSFRAGCRGFESRFPLHTKLVAMKGETFHGQKGGLVAQWQSGRLITGWSQVRILPSPFRSKANEKPVQRTKFAREPFLFYISQQFRVSCV
jgi:hypothetical protein